MLNRIVFLKTLSNKKERLENLIIIFIIRAEDEGLLPSIMCSNELDNLK